MAGIVRKVTMCVLTGILSLSQVAAQDRAILYPVQNVDLNGKDTTVASTVFSGDKIKTKKEAADLIQPGTQVQIEPNSSVQYGQSIVMGCGAILVDGPAQVVAGETNISSGRGARYEVSNRNGKVLIQVQAGVAIVKGGSESDLTLEQGQSALRRGASGCTVPGGWLPGKVGTTAATKGLLIGGAAAVGVACGLKCRWPDPISPSKVSQ